MAVRLKTNLSEATVEQALCNRLTAGSVEFDSYVRVGNLLALLQSKARLASKTRTRQ